MEERMIQAQAMAARVACARMTVLQLAALHVRELMLAVGRAADGMVVSSRRRLLADLRRGDGDGAALEMEKHLRSLLYMWRLVPSGSKTTASEAAT